MLTTSATLLDAAARESIDLAGEDPEEPVEPPAVDDPRPWLVLVDGRGRLTRLGWLRGQPFWRDVLVLCRQSTPADHLNRLRRHHVEHLEAGIEHVDLGGALDQLADRYGVREVRTDAGGTLNGLLWRAGLVDEVSVVVAPQLAGADQVGPVHLVEGFTGADAPQLTLAAVERLPDSMSGCGTPSRFMSHRTLSGGRPVPSVGPAWLFTACLAAHRAESRTHRPEQARSV